MESVSALLLSSEPVSEEVQLFLLASLDESELGGASEEEFLDRLELLDPLGLLPRRCDLVPFSCRSCAKMEAVERREENISKSQLDMR